MNDTLTLEEGEIEIWRDITENNNFQVSNKGRVKRKDIMSRNRGGIYLLKGRIKKLSVSNGYFVVNLAGRTRLVHRLIAIEFISNPKNLRCINHKDGVKSNNDLSNLEWCTYAQNNQHAYDNNLKTGWFTGKYGYDNPSSKEVIKISYDGVVLNRYGSASEAARDNKLSQSNISKCARGEIKTYSGFYWRYSDLSNTTL